MNIYLNIEGKDKDKAIEELEVLAMDTPKVCIRDVMMDTYMPTGTENLDFEPEIITEYFSRLPVQVDVEKCTNLISKKDHNMAKYDFVFEWVTEPTQQQVTKLKDQIQSKLSKLNVSYKVTEN